MSSLLFPPRRRQGELFDQIQERGQLPIADVKFYAAEIVLILEFLHKKGVVHRDLKPENFLFATEVGEDKDKTELKAIDFGLSDFFRPGTKFTDVVGSAYYVAPEVLKRKYGPLADVWSIGVIMYIL